MLLLLLLLLLLQVPVPMSTLFNNMVTLLAGSPTIGLTSPRPSASMYGSVQTTAALAAPATIVIDEEDDTLLTWMVDEFNSKYTVTPGARVPVDHFEDTYTSYADDIPLLFDKYVRPAKSRSIHDPLYHYAGKKAFWGKCLGLLAVKGLIIPPDTAKATNESVIKGICLRRLPHENDTPAPPPSVFQAPSKESPTASVAVSSKSTGIKKKSLLTKQRLANQASSPTPSWVNSTKTKSKGIKKKKTLMAQNAELRAQVQALLQQQQVGGEQQVGEQQQVGGEGQQQVGKCVVRIPKEKVQAAMAAREAQQSEVA